MNIIFYIIKDLVVMLKLYLKHRQLRRDNMKKQGKQF